jgi:hypothetical protein
VELLFKHTTFLFSGRHVQKVAAVDSGKRVVNVSNKNRAEVSTTRAKDPSKSSKNATNKNVRNGLRGPIGPPAQRLAPADNVGGSGNVSIRRPGRSTTNFVSETKKREKAATIRTVLTGRNGLSGQYVRKLAEVDFEARLGNVWCRRLVIKRCARETRVSLKNATRTNVPTGRSGRHGLNVLWLVGEERSREFAIAFCLNLTICFAMEKAKRFGRATATRVRFGRIGRSGLLARHRAEEERRWRLGIAFCRKVWDSSGFNFCVRVIERRSPIVTEMPVLCRVSGPTGVNVQSLAVVEPGTRFGSVSIRETR